MLTWLKKLLDRDYNSVKRWKIKAAMEQQRLVLIWNSYERSTYPLFVPSHVNDVIEFISDKIRGKQLYFTDYFDFREKKVASASNKE